MFSLGEIVLQVTSFSRFLAAGPEHVTDRISGFLLVAIIIICPKVELQMAPELGLRGVQKAQIKLKLSCGFENGRVTIFI